VAEEPNTIVLAVLSSGEDAQRAHKCSRTGTFQPTGSGWPGSAFVSKVNAAGSKLAYSTYLTGNTPSVGNGIAVDSSGSAYVAGNFRGGGTANPFSR
jgi:hypothetical protein